MSALDKILKQIDEINKRKTEIKLDTDKTSEEIGRTNKELRTLDQELERLNGQADVFKNINQQVSDLRFTEKGEEAKSFYDALVKGGFDAETSFELTKKSFEQAFIPLNETTRSAYTLVENLKQSGLPAEELAQKLTLMASSGTEYSDVLKVAVAELNRQITQEEELAKYNKAKIDSENEKYKASEKNLNISEEINASQQESVLLSGETRAAMVAVGDATEQTRKKIEKLNEVLDVMFENSGDILDNFTAINDFDFTNIRNEFGKLSDKLSVVNKKLSDTLFYIQKINESEINPKVKTPTQSDVGQIFRDISNVGG